jgi:pimeloyl-ACP methyl ester carboxylesterase
VLDALRIPKAIVVGHSMGGLVVTELGSRHANRVQGVVAIGPTHPSELLVTVMNKRSETVLEGRPIIPSYASLKYCGRY